MGLVTIKNVHGTYLRNQRKKILRLSSTRKAGRGGLWQLSLSFIIYAEGGSGGNGGDYHGSPGGIGGAGGAGCVYIQW